MQRTSFGIIMSTDNLTTEIPSSSRTPLGSVTMEDSSHGFNESRSVMTKDNLKLLALSTADNFCENQGRESEYAASLADECEENLEQTRSMVRARTNHVRKQTVNSSIKKKPQKKRRVTVNLAATKYDVGKSKLQLILGSMVLVHGHTSMRKIGYICSSCTWKITKVTSVTYVCAVLSYRYTYILRFKVRQVNNLIFVLRFALVNCWN